MPEGALGVDTFLGFVRKAGEQRLGKAKFNEKRSLRGVNELLKRLLTPHCRAKAVFVRS